MERTQVDFESEKVSFGDALLTLQKIQKVLEVVKIPTFHSHCYYELFLVARGTLVVTMKEGESISVPVGNALIIQPNVFHRTNVRNDDIEVVSLGIEVQKKKDANRFYSYFRSVLEDNIGVPLNMEKSLFRKCLNFYSAPPRNSIQQLCHRKMETCDILVGLFDMLSKEHVLYREVDTTSFDIALETMIYSPHVSLREMAAKLGYSERQLYRKIKERYGKSLREIRKEFE